MNFPHLKKLSVDLSSTFSHYKVFAVPVFKADTEPVSAPYMPKTSLKHLLSDTVSFEAVPQTSEARPFIVGSYVEGKLPATLKFDGHWMKSSFKSKTHYSIVVAAFTKVGLTSITLSSIVDLQNYLGWEQLRSAMLPQCTGKSTNIHQ